MLFSQLSFQLVRLRFGALSDFLPLPFVRLRVLRPAERFFTLQALMPEKRLTAFSRQHIWAHGWYFTSGIFVRMTRAGSGRFAGDHEVAFACTSGCLVSGFYP